MAIQQLPRCVTCSMGCIFGQTNPRGEPEHFSCYHGRIALWLGAEHVWKIAEGLESSDSDEVTVPYNDWGYDHDRRKWVRKSGRYLRAV
jgi:hypothetical protein